MSLELYMYVHMSAGGVSASQDLFHDNTPHPQAATPSLDQVCQFFSFLDPALLVFYVVVFVLLIQDPSWYPSARQREEGVERREGGGVREGGEGGGVKRQISTDTESGSNELRPPPPPPPRKKRKLSGSGLSCLQVSCDLFKYARTTSAGVLWSIFTHM